MAERRCAAVVLAAGGSSRLGEPKQLLAVDGETLLHRSVRMAAEVGFAPVYAVLGADADTMRRELAETPAVILDNSAWRNGMGTSLHCGVQAAMAEGATDLLVLLCDQPLLNAGLLRSMRERHELGGRSITAAHYGNTLGVPAIFSRDCFPELLEIEGDRGARELLARRADDVEPIEFVGGAMDLDRPEDVAVWRAAIS